MRSLVADADEQTQHVVEALQLARGEEPVAVQVAQLVHLDEGQVHVASLLGHCVDVGVPADSQATKTLWQHALTKTLWQHALTTARQPEH